MMTSASTRLGFEWSLAVSDPLPERPPWFKVGELA